MKVNPDDVKVTSKSEYYSLIMKYIDEMVELHDRVKNNEIVLDFFVVEEYLCLSQKLGAVCVITPELTKTFEFDITFLKLMALNAEHIANAAHNFLRVTKLDEDEFLTSLYHAVIAKEALYEELEKKYKYFKNNPELDTIIEVDNTKPVFPLEKDDRLSAICKFRKYLRKITDLHQTIDTIDYWHCGWEIIGLAEDISELVSVVKVDLSRHLTKAEYTPFHILAESLDKTKVAMMCSREVTQDQLKLFTNLGLDVEENLNAHILSINVLK